LRAWRANRRTSLGHAVGWAAAAWIAWGAALVFGAPDKLGWEPARYVALCATGAAGVAVLGARRPHVTAWDLVILGLLAVMLLPLAENLFLGTPPVGGMRLFFLGATLGVSIINYVPTRVDWVALVLGGVLAVECLALFSDTLAPGRDVLAILHLGLLLMPWLALVAWSRSGNGASSFDLLWRDFRDRYGVFWAQRVREQYNRSAAHAGLPGFLSWHRWKAGEKEPPVTEAQMLAMYALLKALLGRFLGEPCGRSGEE
jgi:hypothetical protein